MTENERETHVKELLESTDLRSRAFFILGDELVRKTIEVEDFLAMAEMLGFPVEHSEERAIFTSLVRQLRRCRGKRRRHLQIAPARA